MSSTAEQLELVEQKITLTLQKIDSDFVQAHTVACGMLGQVREFAAHMRAVDSSLKTWARFFNSFNDEPAQVLADTTRASFNASAAASAANAAAAGAGASATTPTGALLECSIGRTPSFSTPQIIRFAHRDHTPQTPELGSPPRTTPFAANRHAEMSSSMSSIPSMSSPPISTPFIARRDGDGTDGGDDGVFTPVGVDGSAADWPRFRVEDCEEQVVELQEQQQQREQQQRRVHEDGDQEMVAVMGEGEEEDGEGPAMLKPMDDLSGIAVGMDVDHDDESFGDDSLDTSIPRTPHVGVSPMKTTTIKEVPGRTAAALGPVAAAAASSSGADSMLEDSDLFGVGAVAGRAVEQQQSQHQHHHQCGQDESLDSFDLELDSENVGAHRQHARTGAGDDCVKFDLSMFPSVYQTGLGASQLTSLYQQFEATPEGKTLSLRDLSKRLPSFDDERLRLLLDVLVTRNVLRVRGQDWSR